MGGRDTDKRMGTALFKTVDHAAYSHSGVYNNRNRSGFEKCKYDNKKFQAGFYHQNGTGTAIDACFFKPVGQTVRFPIESQKGKVRICNPAIIVPACRINNRPFIWRYFGHPFKIG
jgi:hypothetical protein